MLEKMDLFLLNKTEKLGHRFQILTGKTNFFLAMILALIVIVLLLLVLFIKKQNPTALDLIFSLIMSSRIITYRFRENEAFDRISKGLSNSLKISIPQKFIRKSCVIVAFLTCIIGAWLLFLLIAGVAFQAYLDSCDPLPPCTGKIREMIDAFFAPKPVPIPIKESDK